MLFTDISSQFYTTMDIDGQVIDCSSDLTAALQQSEELRKKQSAWPPRNEGDEPSRKGLIGVMDDEMGFVD